MSRIFVVGDHKTGTGPANVTKEYIKCLPKGTLYQKRTSKIGRLPELYLNILRSDIIFFSGYSAQNVIGMKFAKKLHKPTAYLVHGAIDHENSINHEENENMSAVEAKTLELADLLLAVSEKFAGWMKNEFPQYADKIDYVTNGIDERKVVGKKDGMNMANAMVSVDGDEARSDNRDTEVENTHDMTKILSIGGGMPRKMIIHLCEAVGKINEQIHNAENTPSEVSNLSINNNAYLETESGNQESVNLGGNVNNQELTLYVIGKDGADTEAINKYPFVKNLGLVPGEKKEELFKECGIFIQNSCFETFGLAPVEALCSGMSVLCSKVCGVLDLFKSADEHDIIDDYADIDEIAKKIKYIMDNPNREKLLADIDFASMSWEARTTELVTKLEALKA